MYRVTRRLTDNNIAAIATLIPIIRTVVVMNHDYHFLYTPTK